MDDLTNTRCCSPSLIVVGRYSFAHQPGAGADVSQENPWTPRRRSERIDYEQDALRQGHLAISSILRDWVKGQITAVDCGILSFEACFMAHMPTSDGRPLIERLADGDLIPKAREQKVVALPAYRS